MNADSDWLRAFQFLHLVTLTFIRERDFGKKVEGTAVTLTVQYQRLQVNMNSFERIISRHKNRSALLKRKQKKVMCHIHKGYYCKQSQWQFKTRSSVEILNYLFL
ncbi:Protein of unknown function [Gryllus bimaculatus]|nr:Protein of unknown function [Gryllus bimaculatus]